MLHACAYTCARVRVRVCMLHFTTKACAHASMHRSRTRPKRMWRHTIYTCGDALWEERAPAFTSKKTTSERCATHCAVDRALVHRGRGRASYIAMAKPSKTQLVTDYIQLEIGRPRMANRMWPCTICTVLARCEWCGCMDGGRRTVDKTVGMTVDAWTVEDGLWTRLWARLWMVDG